MSPSSGTTLCPSLPSGQSQLTVSPTAIVIAAGSNRGTPSPRASTVLWAAGSGVPMAVNTTWLPAPPAIEAKEAC